MDNVDKKILEAYEESVLGERKFDLGSGTMGNGVVIWNRAKEVHGDYEKVAHIDQNRKVKYYIKNPPKQVKDYVEKIAKGKNFAASTSQPHMKVFKEEKNDIDEAYKVAQNPSDKLWYALGSVGKYWMPISSGYKSKKEAEGFAKKQPMADKAAKKLMPEGYDRREKIFKDAMKKVHKDADTGLWGKVVIGLDELKKRLALLM